MNSEPKKRLWLVALPVAALLVTFGFRAACSSLNPCSNTILTSVPSPDGEKNVVTFARDCGATTSASAQVSLLDRAQALPNEPANLLIIESPGGPFAKPVRIAWESQSTLTITYPAKSQRFKQLTELDGVSVRYSEE